MTRGVDNRTMIVHTMTLERSPLPGPAELEWSFFFDGSGFGCLLRGDCPDGEEPLLLEHSIRRRLSANPDGELIVEEQRSLGGDGSQWSFSHKAQRTEASEVKLRMGPNKLHVISTCMPHCGPECKLMPSFTSPLCTRLWGWLATGASGVSGSMLFRQSGSIT